jgi:hypothetical protein
VFPQVVAALRALPLPAALHVEELAAPLRVADSGWAVTGRVLGADAQRSLGDGADGRAGGTGGSDFVDGADSELLVADGRFVLLHGLHPRLTSPPDGARSNSVRARTVRPAPGQAVAQWRVVVLVRALVDPPTVQDPLVTSVAWQALTEALDQAGARVLDRAGTVTRTVSEAFGVGDDAADEPTVELRASWTPVWTGPPARSARAHLWAWAALLASAGGLAGVSRRPPASTRVAKPSRVEDRI